MVIRYFAWLRDYTGCSSEQLDCPTDVKTITDLIEYLCSRSHGHRSAFENGGVIRAAINQEFASSDDAISPTDEVAFFPPVTGG